MAPKDKNVQVFHAPILTWRDIEPLLTTNEFPCISIYVPTSPGSNCRHGNCNRYKDQIRKIRATLEHRGVDEHLAANLIEALELIGTLDVFWKHQQYGLAVFISAAQFLVRSMASQPLQPLGVVTNNFRLHPALRETMHWMRYQVLCLGEHRVALYEGDRQHLRKVQLHSKVPCNIADSDGTSPDGKSNGLKHYFQAVDQVICEQYGDLVQTPLILAALAEHRKLYQEISNNPNLLEAGLNKEPFEEIRQNRFDDTVRLIAKQALQIDLERRVRHYEMRAARGESENALEKVAQAAMKGQIETLLIDENLHVKGNMDPATGAIRAAGETHGHTHDVVEALARYVIGANGTLRFIPTEKMPTDTGVAAVLRHARPQP